MLSMKTLRVAVVAMGSALLLGSGIAAAQVNINLDGTAAATTPEPPVSRKIATQTIPDADATTRLRHVNLGDTGVNIQITPGIVLDDADGYFLRVALGGGAMFRGTVTAPTGTTLAQGGAGNSQAVFRLSADTTIDGALSLGIGDNIGLPNADEASYTASMTLHTEVLDARDGIGALSGIGATGITIIEAASGVDATITPGNAVADVAAQGFRWFVNPDATMRDTMPNVSGVALGTANATAAAAIAGVVNADDGTALESVDLIATDGVTIGIEGDFSVGVYDLVLFTDADSDPQTPDVAPCPDRKGSANTPTVQGMAPMIAGANEVIPDEDDPTMAMVADLAPGKYQFCVEVDLAGPMTNASPIPASQYTATVYTRQTGEQARDNVMEGEGTIANITRNGASVTVSYLTTSEKHNQRLIIVNRGTRPVSILDVDFHSEDGTEATLSAAALAAAGTDAAMIMPGEAVMHRVRDMLSITGNSARTAATLSFNAVAGQLDVATTQVNLADGSTDTVMWPVD